MPKQYPIGKQELHIITNFNTLDDEIEGEEGERFSIKSEK